MFFGLSSDMFCFIKKQVFTVDIVDVIGLSSWLAEKKGEKIFFFFLKKKMIYITARSGVHTYNQ